MTKTRFGKLIVSSSSSPERKCVCVWSWRDAPSRLKAFMIGRADYVVLVPEEYVRDPLYSQWHARQGDVIPWLGSVLLIRDLFDGSRLLIIVRDERLSGGTPGGEHVRTA